MLKKIVKTLRQNWHPDRATREEERLMRERRLKQINVAWDIIRGKQASGKGSSA
jgi:DnaJ-class molecular chaperone